MAVEGAGPPVNEEGEARLFSEVIRFLTRPAVATRLVADAVVASRARRTGRAGARRLGMAPSHSLVVDGGDRRADMPRDEDTRDDRAEAPTSGNSTGGADGQGSLCEASVAASPPTAATLVMTGEDC